MGQETLARVQPDRLLHWVQFGAVWRQRHERDRGRRFERLGIVLAGAVEDRDGVLAGR